MAKPRVFISSTFYDLRQIREDLERSIRELGYEPIRNETGSIAYGKDSPPENYVYKELELCDILVSIIGGRYGTESRGEPGYSISQTELKRALDRGIQVFVFIEKSVNAEFETYRINKENNTIKYKFADNTKVYEFIDFVHGLPYNNPIFTFEISADISSYLRAQWAGLFQRFLQEEKRQSEFRVLDEMRSVSSTLQDLVRFLTEERRNNDGAIKEILMANHPAFRRLAELTSTPYRIYFTNKEELGRWLRARQWSETDEIVWDDPKRPEWQHDSGNYISYDPILFDEFGRLKPFTNGEWSDDWVSITRVVPPNQSPVQNERRDVLTTPRRPPVPSTEDDDNDIPF